MSLSRGMIIKRGRPTLPQWAVRPLVTQNIPQASGYVTLIDVGDAMLVTLAVTNNGLANRNYGARITVDGQVYETPGGGVQVNVGVTEYFSVDPVNDALLLDTTITSLLAPSMGLWGQSLRVEGDSFNGATNNDFTVRYLHL